jgi:hypothetical protein
VRAGGGGVRRAGGGGSGGPIVKNASPPLARNEVEQGILPKLTDCLVVLWAVKMSKCRDPRIVDEGLRWHMCRHVLTILPR